MLGRRRRSAEPAPINAPWPVVEEWLTSAPRDAAFLASEAAWSPVFTTQSFAPGQAELDDLWTTGGDVSWLGGPAVLPLAEWPRRPDGTPLAHVLTVSLADVHGTDPEDRAAWPDHDGGLPTTGVLEVFHDLTDTYGWEPEDRDSGGWLVRWVEDPDRSGLADVPDDVGTPTEVCRPGVFLPGFSVRSSADFIGAGTDRFDAAERVTEEFQRAWLLQQTGSAHGHPVPVTHVYGHSQNGAGEALRVLATALPLEDGDTHRLILDVESWTHLSEWFGDAAPLEVWMRESDLRARRFDRAWCIVRTD